MATATASKPALKAKAEPTVPPINVQPFVQLMKLLGDETRVRILCLLSAAPDRTLNVTELCEKLGQSQPAISHHLALLRVSNVVESTRDGKHNRYGVVPAAFEEPTKFIAYLS